MVDIVYILLFCILELQKYLSVSVSVYLQR